MTCSCNRTTSTPTQVVTPELNFTLGSPARYVYGGSYDTRFTDVQQFREWKLAETDLFVHFIYKHQDNYEVPGYEGFPMYAEINVSENADGSDSETAASDFAAVANTNTGEWFTTQVSLLVRKGLYYQCLAVPAMEESVLTGEGAALYEHAAVTIVPWSVPDSSASTSSCSSSSSCDPCAPATNCHRPLPMPVVVVPGANPALAGCTSPKAYETLPSFTIPAVDASAPLKVCDPTQWPIGLCVFLSAGEGQAILRVTAQDLTAKTITLQNYGADGNATPGSVFPSGSVMTAIGPCPANAAETCARAGWEVGEAFVVPAVGVDVEVVIEPCITAVEGQKIFFSTGGWFTLQSIDETTDTGSVCTFRQHTLLPGVTAGVSTVVAGSYVIADEPQVAEEFSPTSGDLVEFFTDGEIDVTSSVDLDSPGSLTFVTQWPADVEILWKVGQNGAAAIGNAHGHWGIKLDTVTKSDASNDADMSGYMASSNWGRVVVEDVAAGSHTAGIFRSAATSDIPDLDVWRIQVFAHRKQASVS